VRVDLVAPAAGTVGGTERVAFGLAAHLASRDMEVRLWVGRIDDPPPGVDVRLHRGLRARGRAWKIGAAALALRDLPPGGLKVSLLRAIGADVWRAGGGAHGAWMARSGRGGPVDRLERWVDGQVARSAGVVVANSLLGARDLVEYCGIPPIGAPGGPVLVRNGVDLDRFRPGAGPPPGPGAWVGFLGADFRRKGLQHVLNAVRRLPGLRLLVIGADPRAPAFEARARELGIADRVVFAGRVSDPERLLPGLRAMVLPTQYDPSANATLEALACGVPVITTPADGASEVLPLSWLTCLHPEDPVELSALMERVLDTPELPAACRAAAERWPLARAHAELEAVIRHAGERQ
jgi:UDP-glucose:(heptosyl)LPS alpha-1,3-glucosyltransferase